MAFDLKILREKVLLHGSVCRTVIVETKGSVPRETGTEMLIWEGGQQGTIGGGALEFQATKKSFDGEYLKTVPLGPNLGQCCGGSVTIVNEIFNLDRLDRMNSKKFFSRQVAGSNKKPCSILKLENNINNKFGNLKPSPPPPPPSTQPTPSLPMRSRFFPSGAMVAVVVGEEDQTPKRRMKAKTTRPRPRKCTISDQPPSNGVYRTTSDPIS